MEKNYLKDIQKLFKREKPLFLVISGSHAYGFARIASDIDIRGCHLSSTSDLLSIYKPTMTIKRELSSELLGKVQSKQKKEKKTKKEKKKKEKKKLPELKPQKIDLVSHELEKFIWLMLKGSGTIIENLYSPLPILVTSEAKELQKLGKECITRRCHGHYFGFGRKVADTAKRENYQDIKEVLYAYRIYLTGINLLETGEAIIDLNDLADKYAFDLPTEVIGALNKGVMEITTAQKRRINQDFPRLKSLLDEALNKSNIPFAPSEETTMKMNDFLLKVRKKNW